MKKPDQPEVTVTATATRVYVFEPSAERTVASWEGTTLAAARIRIVSHDSGKVTAQCDLAYGFRKDGEVSRQQRGAQSWWSLSHAPEWVQRLAADMPIPRVTLVPPSKETK